MLIAKLANQLVRLDAETASGALDTIALEEIISTVDSTLAGEALLVQLEATIMALDTVRVPCAIQNLQQELVSNRQIAAGTADDLHSRWWWWWWFVWWWW